MSIDGLCPDCDMPVPADAETCPHCGSVLDLLPPLTSPRRRKQERAASKRSASGCLTTLVALLLVAVAACTRAAGPTIPTEPPGGALVAFHSHVVAVELAVRQDEWEKGLMGRTHLDANSGMLFLFPQASSLAFYMKNTLIPLSIAFLQRKQGQTYRVAKVLDMTPCKADPCHLYNPGVSYDAALEVNSGWFVRNGVHIGSTAQVGRAPTHT